MVGYDKIAEFFNEKKDSDKIKVAIADFDYLRPMSKFEVVDITNEKQVSQADYLVIPDYRPDKLAFYTNKYGLKKADEEVKIAGIAYYKIFKLKKNNAAKQQ